LTKLQKLVALPGGHVVTISGAAKAMTNGEFWAVVMLTKATKNMKGGVN